MTTFVIGLGIRFFLTPYIVKSLGPEAYGFIGLASDILSYTGLVTIALNSMAGRYVTISYVSGDVEKANKYYASVFYSNVFMAAVILIFAIGCVIWLEKMIYVPSTMLGDVKLLFSLLAFNNIVGLITGIWGVATFIKNRVDLSNVRSVIGSILKVGVIILLFGCFAPHVWYVGLAGVVTTLYCAFANKKLSSWLTPELKVSRHNFDFQRVKELIKSGSWNVVTRVGSILGSGMDLLIANVCIGSTEMGLFALTRSVPFLILSLFQSISGVFAPVFTNLYAKDRHEDLLLEILKSIRILSFFTVLPLAFLYFYGKEFYALWLPSEDAGRLQLLTVLGTFALPYTLPLEALWSIFTVTNKLKYSTLFSLLDNLMVFLIVMSSMLVVSSPATRLIVLASTRSICGVVRGGVFLPLYGAHCLQLRHGIFYKTIGLALLNMGICFGCCWGFRSLSVPKTWCGLMVVGIGVCLICCVVSAMVILTPRDRLFIYNKIFKRK